MKVALALLTILTLMKNFLKGYIGPDSMTHWIIEKFHGFNDLGLLRISESVRAYAYLILSSQSCVRSSIIANTASALTAQRAFLNNFKNVMNRRVDIEKTLNVNKRPSVTNRAMSITAWEKIFTCCLVI